MSRGGLAGLALCIVLAACGTPRERCVRGVNNELQTVNRLIAETELNLLRGYTYETELRNTYVGVSGCLGRSRYYRGGGGVRFCGSTEPRAVKKAVPIDPAAEQRKLAGLKERQAELTSISARAAEVCAARYPG